MIVRVAALRVPIDGLRENLKCIFVSLAFDE